MIEKSAKAPNSRLWLVCLICISACISLFATTSVLAADKQLIQHPSSPHPRRPGQQEQRLDKLRREIGGLRTELENARKSKSSVEDQLKVTEKSIGKIASLLRSLDKHIERQTNKIAVLTRRQSKAAARIEKHKNALAKQLRATYLLGRQPYLKLLLNQQHPQKLARTLAYFNYYSRAKVARIDHLNSEVAELQHVKQAIQASNSQIERDKSEKLAEKKNLENYHRQRITLLTGLNKQINTKGLRLKRLLEDEQRLSALVQHLQSDIITEPLDEKPFAESKGSLLWPVQGPLIAKFGRRRNIGQLKWQGVMISSKAGSEVRAVSRGRVAFADWFRGFGLLIIIDHGNGYMSLYGHNDSLYKEQGDRVEANEVIARVGPGSGKAKPGLYFELRHKGKPINPLRWCKKMSNH